MHINIKHTDILSVLILLCFTLLLHLQDVLEIRNGMQRMHQDLNTNWSCCGSQFYIEWSHVRP